MRTKEELLRSITAFASQHAVTKEEILAAYDSGYDPTTVISANKRLSAAEILTYIGGGIVVLGIAILINQNWQYLNFAVKILVTCGSGVATYFAGFILSKSNKLGAAGSAFFMISALVLPIGIFILVDNTGYNWTSYASQSIASGILLAIFLVSYFLLHKNIFVLFSIAFGTWFYYCIANYVLDAPLSIITDDDFGKFYSYCTLITGMAYIALGYLFVDTTRSKLTEVLYALGAFGILCAGYVLEGFGPHKSVPWEVIFPFIIFGVILGSIYLQSTSFLSFGALFLVLYIIKITFEYFSKGLGWPLSLVFSGLMTIGIGMMFMRFKRKYITNVLKT